MNGFELKRIRTSRGLSQQQLAEKLRTSQKRISVLENSTAEVPPEFIEKLTAIPQESSQTNASSPIQSKRHTHDVATHRVVTRTARHYARCIKLVADLRPPEDEAHKGTFVDARIRITFEGLDLRGEPLYMDHLGNPDGPDGRPVPFIFDGPSHDRQASRERLERQNLLGISQGEVIDSFDSDDVELAFSSRARIAEDPSVKATHGVHAIGYQILSADRYEPTHVYLKADQGLRLRQAEAIGFPLYPDLATDELSVEVRFHEGLRPFPNPPTIKAQLIRRTSFLPWTNAEDFEPLSPIAAGPDGVLSAQFTLVRPRGGYFYTLQWGRISSINPVT